MINDSTSLQRSTWGGGDVAAGCSGTQPCLAWEAEQGRAPEAGESDTLFCHRIYGRSLRFVSSRGAVKLPRELPWVWLQHRTSPAILQAQQRSFGVGAHRQQTPADGPYVSQKAEMSPELCSSAGRRELRTWHGSGSTWCPSSMVVPLRAAPQHKKYGTELSQEGSASL